MDETVIEVFVRSFSEYADVELYREMVRHSYCAPTSHEALLKQALSKFEGRILPQEDLTVLERVLEIKEKTNEQIKIYDISRVTDKIKAIKHGILKTPATIINGKKYEGVQEILQAISNKT